MITTWTAAEKATAEKAGIDKVTTGKTVTEKVAVDKAPVKEAVIEKVSVDKNAEDLLSCCYCKLSNKTSRALKLHKNMSHKKELRESEREHLETTGNSETTVKIYCKTCNFVAENSESLRTHNRQKHRVFACEVCAFSSSSEKGLNVHVTKAHSKYKEKEKVFEVELRHGYSCYICNICDEPSNPAYVYDCMHPFKMSDHFNEQHSYMRDEISQEQKSLLEKLSLQGKHSY